MRFAPRLAPWAAFLRRFAAAFQVAATLADRIRAQLFQHSLTAES
jgi:hypothetical protein